MKMIFLLYAFIFFSIQHNTHAQGNLQFNQVLNLSYSTNGTNFSVPVGKVWKIECVGMASYQSYYSVSVAGQQIFLKNTHSGYGPSFDSFPFWLSGGQSVFMSGLTGGVASVIEFNIVP